MFIVFEGLDGSGSSTQAKLLTERLKKLNKKVVQTKEPTTGVIGKLIRDFLQHKYSTSAKALQLLFTADREDHLHNIIKPNLKEGKIVISDRYYLSTIAFGAQVVDFNWLKQLQKDFIKPDFVFLLKVDPKECIKRIESRGEEKELFEKEEILTKVWKNYEKLSNEKFIHIIDGMQSIEQIEKEIFGIINNG